MAANTISAYLNDISKFAQYLDFAGKKFEVENIDVEDIKKFITWINELGMQVSSQSRLISGLKSFFGFLLIEDVITTDPTLLLEMPRISKLLPDTLNIEEINSIVEAVDASKPEGIRNKAIIEVLYGCGLRVSELINLKISNLFIQEEYLKVIGKGNKERIMPVGSIAFLISLLLS